MATEATETDKSTAILEQMLETKLFGRLSEVTDDDIAWAKVKKCKELSGSDRSGKGKVAGPLSRLEQALLTLQYKLKEEAVEIARTQIASLPAALRGEIPDEAQLMEMVSEAERMKDLEKKAWLFGEIATQLIDEHFREQMDDDQICTMWIDEDFNMRVSTHEEEHPGHIQVRVIGVRRRNHRHDD